MKIGLNATAFQPGKMGGMETYFRNLLISLQEVDNENDYSLLCDSHYIKELAITNPHFKAVPCNFTKPSLGWFLRGVVRNATKFDILCPVMNRFDADVILHPFSYLNPLKTTTPSILTFHDMQHEFFPEYFSPYEKKIRKAFYRPSPARATRIIAISQHAKSCLVEKYGINSGKIDVIYNGYNPAFKILGDPAGLEEVRLKYGLDRPFMYYPAATWPHKNHKTLLAALKIMKERYRFDGQLVLTGIAMQAHDKILGEVVQLGLEDEVKVLGYLPYADLPHVYNLARLLVFPSRFEGFGIPPVEAMACGCPVACSNVTSIPEVVGNAGVYFDPLSAEDIAEKTWKLWTDETMRKGVIKAGLKRVKLFTWDEAARKTMNVFQKALTLLIWAIIISGISLKSVA
jgi:glycosyltransferase involved in cell wall biosynthesis